jgi:sulfate/thiosulfate transport system ATP-binding protein
MSILLEHLTKSYDGHGIVNDVSLEVNDGELFVLLGASGSGKSTILRLIAGLTLCDSGRIVLHGRDVTHLAPQARNTGFVFQNYSIFRHMTLAENIEFGLKIRNMPKAQRASRCEELLDLVDLAGLGDRYPDQISGGQQQRVALARALAYEPSVLLLDEPLGALDVKIRAQLRRGLKEVQRRLRVTTILVTHDQEEGFELGDRIGVLERGLLLEVGEPERLYHRPRTLFVAGFLGGGTVLAGRVKEAAAQFGPLVLPVPDDAPHEEAAPVEVLIRPEQVAVSVEEPSDRQRVLGKGRMIEQIFAGAQRRLRLRLPRLATTRQIAPVPPFGEEGILVDVIAPAQIAQREQELWISLTGWTILQQSPPRVLAVDANETASATLVLAKHFADAMNGSVSVLGWAHLKSDDLKDKLKRRMDEAGLAGAELNVRSGKLAEQIELHRAGLLFDLAVLPRHLHARGGTIDPAILSFLENADIPVLLTGESSTNVIKQILICTRAGESGKNDIRLGGRFARHLGATVTLLHVTRGTGDPPRQIHNHLQHGVCSLAGMEVSSQIRIRSGQPVEEILAEAKDHDLIVIGGHGPQVRSLFGVDDVAMGIMNHARNPVLVIPVE